MVKFEKILPGIYMMKVPFSTIWSGVFLVEGTEKVLVDSCVSATSVDDYIVPGLKELGLELSDIGWLINTHGHGDHMGGNDRILTSCPSVKLAAYEETAVKLADPLPYSIATRAKWPEHSPKPPQYIPAHKADLVLKEGDVLAGRLQIVHTPGHDTECISLLDTQTNSVLTGDSVQAFGMHGVDGAGLAFYKDLPAYRKSMEKLELLKVDNIFFSHDFRPFGYAARGRDEVRTMLKVCKVAPEIYTMLVRKKMNEGITELDQLAVAVLGELGVEPPPMLFQPMYTLYEHVKELKG